MKKEKNNIKLRLISGLLTVSLAAGTAYALKPTNAYATGSKIVISTPVTKYKNYAGHKIGEYVDESTGMVYYTIEVIENDNASRISEVAIAVYNKEKQIPDEDLELFSAPNTKTSRSSFWPAVVYMNVEKGRKFRINPGDILIIPTEYSKFKALNGQVKSSGWYSRYCAANNIHQPKMTVTVPKETVRALVQNIYDELYPDANVCVDDDVLRAYLRAHSSKIKYEFNKDSELDNNTYFELTEWIPTPSELEGFYVPTQKNKTH